MSLSSAVHVSSTFEFGAMLHECLSVDPPVQSSILLFSEPHECHCLALFMCPPPSSLELCFMIAYVRTLKAILHSPPFSEPHECYCLVLFMCPPPPSLELCFLIA